MKRSQIIFASVLIVVVAVLAILIYQAHLERPDGEAAKEGHVESREHVRIAQLEAKRARYEAWRKRRELRQDEAAPPEFTSIEQAELDELLHRTGTRAADRSTRVP
jgi:hypothetical protein